MPRLGETKRSNTISTMSGSGELANKVLSEVNWDNDELYRFDDSAIKNLISEFTMVNAARTPEEVDEQNMQQFKAAMQTIVFAEHQSDKPVLSRTEISDRDKITKKIEKSFVKSIVQVCFVFAFLHGNITDRKYWIRLSHSDANQKSTYVSFPSLSTKGQRSTLVHYFKEQISLELEKGTDNTLTQLLKKNNIEIDEKKRKYLFPKGHTLFTNKDDIAKARADLQNIFAQLAVPVDQRKYDLKFFVKNK